MPRLKQEQDISLGSITTPGDRDLRSENVNLMHDIGRNWYRLSRNLTETYDSEVYRVWGYNSFREYVDTELTDIEYRIAVYRVQTGRAINRLGLGEEVVAELGWSKFKELIGVIDDSMTQKDVIEMIDECKGKTYLKVKEYVQELKSKRLGGELVKRMVLKFDVAEEVGIAINAVLEEIKKLLGETASTGTCLEYGLTEWAYNHNPELKEGLLKQLKSTEIEAKAEEKPIVHSKPHLDKGRKRGVYKTKSGKPITVQEMRKQAKAQNPKTNRRGGKDGRAKGLNSEQRTSPI